MRRFHVILVAEIETRGSYECAYEIAEGLAQALENDDLRGNQVVEAHVDEVEEHDDEA